MVRSLFLFLIISSSSPLLAQVLSESEQANLRARLESFAELNKAEDYEKLVDLFYPRLMESSSREQMIRQFTIMESYGVDVIIDKLEISKIDAVHRNEKGTYALGTCSMIMRIVMKSVPSESQMVYSLRSFYGSKNSSYDEKTKTIRITAPKYMVGIKEEAYGDDWYFLEFTKQDNRPIYTILGSEIGQKIVAKAN